MLPPKSPGENPSHLFQLLEAPGVPWLVATFLPSLPLSSHWDCVHITLSFKRISFYLHGLL